MAEKKNQGVMVMVALLAVGVIFVTGIFMGREAAPRKRIIASAQAPAPIGPYSQAILAGGTLYISGQLGIDPATGALAEGVAAQARLALDNLKAILAEAGMDFSDIVQTRIFLQDMADFQKVNEIYARCFKGAFPARATVQVAALPKGGLVEIEMTACR